MKLIPEQIEMLKMQYDNYQKQRISLIEGKDSTSPIVLEGQTTDISYSLIKRIAELSKRTDEIKFILENATVVENTNYDYVDVGSKFRAFVIFGDDDSDIIEATFIEKKVANEGYDEYISGESDFGLAIYHKQVGDVFYYPLANGKVAKGTILEFVNQKKDPNTLTKKDR